MILKGHANLFIGFPVGKPGLNHIHQNQSQTNRQQTGQRIESCGLPQKTAKALHPVQAGDPGNNGRDDQRNDDHLEEIQEQLPHIRRKRNDAIHKAPGLPAARGKIPKKESGHRSES